MANVLSQEFLSIGRGKTLVVTVVQQTQVSDSQDLPRMLSDSGKVAQLRRPSDNPGATVSQTDIDTAAFTSLNGRPGNEVLLVSFHPDPIVTPR